MRKLRKNDLVQVLKGKDAGKKGKILRVFRSENRVIVEGLNLAKKHKRKTQADQQGGVVSIEAPINISNLALVCKHCNRGVRLGFVLMKDGAKARICKTCEEVL